MSYNSFEWLPLTAGLTILGLLLSYVAYRRRGLRPALMGTAISLLPIAAYLTGATEMLWKIGVAIGQFGTGFVFSPEKWAGIGVTALAVALFLAAGGRQRRRAAREARQARRAGRAEESTPAEGRADRAGLAAADRTQALATRGTGRTPVPADRAASQPTGKASRRQQPPVDDDMKDIEDILRQRGI
jgi:heme exporter protein D